jgi:hypothetical protein
VQICAAGRDVHDYDSRKVLIRQAVQRDLCGLDESKHIYAQEDGVARVELISIAPKVA